MSLSRRLFLTLILSVGVGILLGLSYLFFPRLSFFPANIFLSSMLIAGLLGERLRWKFIFILLSLPIIMLSFAAIMFLAFFWVLL